MKISARNRLKGKVGISVAASVTSTITEDSAEELSVNVGDQVEAVTKSTKVMIAE